MNTKDHPRNAKTEREKSPTLRLGSARVSNPQSPISNLLLTLLALALLVIPAASPYFLPGVPRTNDLTPHLMRTYFWGEAVAYSGLWPRWSAELIYGYGYPVFNFFPSLVHAFIQLIHQLGFPLLTAYRIAVYLHFLLAAISSYLLGKKVFHSQVAGWGTAVIYVYSPYLLYDVIVRGAPPETQALALLPLLILAIWKASEPSALPTSLLPIPLTAILFALTFLSHPASYVFLLPIGVWLLIKAGFARKNGRFWQTLIGPTIGITLGVLLTTFFWLPAFLEIPFTRAELAISQGYTYQENFLSLIEMFRWPILPADPALINPPLVRALPLVGLLWAIVVILWQWRQTDRFQRETILAWTAVLIFTIWLITPASQFVWNNVRLLSLILYPWRLLSISSIAIAILVALSLQILGKKMSSRRAILPPLLLTSLILISSIPWLFPPRQAMPENINAAQALGSELPPYFIGTTTLGEFLPIQVDELPPLLATDEQLRAGQNPDRLQPADGVSWTRFIDNPIAARYQIQLDSPQTLTYQQFDFPGWQVTLNGQPIPIIPSQPDGLITFELPAGQHDLQISFGNSKVRQVAWLISGVAFILLIALTVVALRQRKNKPSPELVEGRGDAGFDKSRPEITSTKTSTLPPTHLFILGGTAVFIWLFFSFIDTPLRRNTLQPDSIYGKPTITPIDFAGEVKLLSYEIPATAVSADTPIPLTLYLAAQRNIGVPYNIGIQIRDSQGLNWMAGNSRPNDWRFIADEPWPLDAYRMEPYLINLLDGTPPGEYQFHVGLVRADTNETVAAYDIAPLQISQAMQGALPLENGMSPAPKTAVANDIQLLGTRLDRPVATPGDPLRITTLWQLIGDNPDNQFTLQLLAEDGTILIEKAITIAPDYPLDQWQPSDRLRTETLLRLPASTPNGELTWQVSWGEQRISAGKININAPQRTFEIPEIETAVNETFSNTATLLGLAPQLPNSPAPQLLTLIWQANSETPTSYRVFVHLIAPDGTILAQSDGEPANWSRPTTSWLPGEIISDEHTLTLPADLPEGTQLRIGLYDPATQQRLSTKTADSVTLPFPSP